MKNFYDHTNATLKTNNDETVIAQDIIDAARTSSEVFFRQYSNRIPTLDVDDLFSETVCRAISGIGNFDSRKASLKTWVSRIALHYLFDYQTREKKRTALFESFTGVDEEGDEYVSPLIAGYRGDEYEADRDLITAEALNEIEGAFSKMIESRRVVVKLFGEGYKVREICKITGWTPSKVSALLNRGKSDFRGNLGKETLQDYGFAA